MKFSHFHVREEGFLLREDHGCFSTRRDALQQLRIIKKDRVAEGGWTIYSTSTSATPSSYRMEAPDGSTRTVRVVPVDVPYAECNH